MSLLYNFSVFLCIILAVISWAGMTKLGIIFFILLGFMQTIFLSKMFSSRKEEETEEEPSVSEADNLDQEPQENSLNEASAETDEIESESDSEGKGQKDSLQKRLFSGKSPKDRKGNRVFFLMFSSLFTFIVFYMMLSWYPPFPSSYFQQEPVPTKTSLFYIGSALFLYFYFIFGIRLCEGFEGKTKDEETKNSASWCRFLCYTALITLISASIELAAGYFEGYAKTVALAISGFCLFVISTAGILIQFSIFWNVLTKITQLSSEDGYFNGFHFPLLVDITSCEPGLKRSFLSCVNRRFNLDLTQSEIAKYMGKIFGPTCISALIFFWASTCVVIVPPDKECIICRFGVVPQRKAQGPGLHFKLPWPCADAFFFTTGKINTMNVGFEAAEEKTDLIWSRRHSLTNDHFVVGDGIELINIDCQVLWKVKDLYKYVSSMQNPEEFLKSAAYKLLTLSTVNSTFDDIISQDRRILTNALKTGLQEQSDSHNLGIEIVEVLFLAIHPPLQVAAAFEDVISAKLDKLTYVLKANAENQHKYHFHKADSVAITLKAESNGIEAIQKATGEAASIISRGRAFNAEPQLEKYRLKLDLMQRILNSKSLYIVDKNMMRSQDSIYLNLSSN